ncbi:ABC transporter ATP-binding protein [Nocardioides sp.]|uniref:ABC transporter ATP-binding protein n=1 Tax=Nocardioides sp. TaxID=35761 RepID=UPI00198E7226|nr:ABC transporter ATP-binding protein [Nocardioides sp.]MBC7277918.1 ABC transporter ATP-binding protein [Nocardioides sp.]
MSDQKADETGQMKQTERIVRPQGGPGPMGGGGAVGDKAMTFVPSAKRLLRRMAPYKLHAVATIALAAISVTLMSLGPWLLGRATDIIFGGVFSRELPAGVTQEEAVEGLRAQGDDKVADMLSGMDYVTPGQGVDFDALRSALLVVLVVYLVASLLSFAQGWILNSVVQGTVKGLREDVEKKVHNVPLSYFDKQPRGELLSRVTNDIDNISQTLQQTFSQVLTALFTLVTVLFMMFWISPMLALIALLAVPVSLVVTSAVMKRSQGQFVAQWRHTGKLNGHIEETFSGHDQVLVFGRQEEVEKTFAEENDKLFAASFKAQFISGILMPLMMFVGNLMFVVVCVVGSLRVASGSLSLGELQAFIQYSRQFTQPITTLASMMNLLQSGVASAERVFELLDAEEQSPEVGAPRTGPGAGEVRFEQVSFSYDKDKPLIEDLSLVARPGQTVAIVGPTGAGKTTLVNLIMRFYELDAGRITLDGADIASIPRSDLRERTGMVLQDTWLFEGTIRDNIRYGRPSATDEELLEAARATYVDRFVHSLPDGYDTLVTDQGGNLSAGERQLVTIARAFLAEPSLLILDEATSSVDTRTELLLQHAMAALRSDRTSFVIAHRLSTIRDADLILVMRDGAIVEQGNHVELLEAKGAYADLYQSQFSHPLVDEPA